MRNVFTAALLLVGLLAIPALAQDDMTTVGLGEHPDQVVKGETWFRIDHVGYLDINVLFSNDEGDIDIEVYGPDMDWPINSSSSTSDNEHLIVHSDGELMLKVYMFSGDESHFDLVLSEVPVYDGSDAAHSATGTSWLVLPELHGLFEISVSFDSSQGDIDITAYDSYMTMQDSSTDVGSTETVVVLADGDVILEVTLYGETPVDYTVSLTEAELLTLGAGTHELTATGRNFYKVSGIEGLYEIVLDFVHDNGDIDFTVYDADMYYIDSSATYEDRERVALLADGSDLILEVRLYGPEDNPFTLTVQETDTLEPIPAEAMAVEVGGSYPDLVVGEEDDVWFVCEVDGPVTFEFLFSHDAGDIDVAVHDGRMIEIEGAASSSDNEVVSLEHSGTLYLHVYLFGSGSNTFTLNVKGE